MEREEFLKLSPAQLYDSFNQVRRYFSKQIEDEHSEERDAQIRNEWLEKRPKKFDRQLLERLGVTQEDFSQYLTEEDDTYRAFHDSILKQDAMESLDPDFGLPIAPEINTSAAFPYAVVVIGKTQESIKDFDGEASGNPDAWKLAGFSARQPFYLELWGSGTGFYDWSLIPEYNSSDFRTVQWYFIHMPFGDGEWSCSARPWFHGAYSVWSDDHFLTSRFARVLMNANICLLPFGYPTPKYHHMQCSGDLVIDEGGQNIDKYRWGDWLPKLSKLTPYPFHRQKPHWIIVSASGQVIVRGKSHALLDFARYHTSSGSVEGGTYKETKYGLYCHTATIHW